jgi:hypothetical protein
MSEHIYEDRHRIVRSSSQTRAQGHGTSRVTPLACPACHPILARLLPNTTADTSDVGWYVWCAWFLVLLPVLAVVGIVKGWW